MSVPSRDARKLRWQAVLNEWECPHGVEVVMMCPTCLPNMVLAFADAELAPRYLPEESTAENGFEAAEEEIEATLGAEIKATRNTPAVEAMIAEHHAQMEIEQGQVQLGGVIRRTSREGKIKSRIKAPFTEAQATGLNQYQRAGRMHPFTCPREHLYERPYGTQTLLVAVTDAGWVCSAPPCDYTQDWAHTFMVDPWFTTDVYTIRGTP